MTFIIFLLYFLILNQMQALRNMDVSLLYSKYPEWYLAQSRWPVNTQ